MEAYLSAGSVKPSRIATSNARRCGHQRVGTSSARCPSPCGHGPIIQFTPDLLPGDLIGITIYRDPPGEFAFQPGPLFAEIILADEINRATPRTQSALLEAMSERQVTTDGETRKLGPPFLVVATQNPHEFEGTYPLPRASWIGS